MWFNVNHKIHRTMLRLLILAGFVLVCLSEVNIHPRVHIEPDYNIHEAPVRKDGKPIDASNRMSFLHDFGFVALDLKYTRPGDSGRYTIRAANALGQTEISANLKVLSGKSGAEMESMHGEALEKIAYLVIYIQL